MATETLWDVLVRLSVLRKGHFILGGNYRSKRLCVEHYLDVQNLVCRPFLLRWITAAVADKAFEQFRNQLTRDSPPVIVGIERGGRILAPFLGYHLSKKLAHPAALTCVTALRTVDGRYHVDPREEQFLAHANDALLVVDVLMSGSKVLRAIEALNRTGIELDIAGIAAIVDRAQRRDLEIRSLPVVTALELEPALGGGDCLLCRDGSAPQDAPEDWFPNEKR